MPELTDKVWQLEWAYGRAEIQSRGGMLGPVWFQIEDGREFQPMHVAPWAEEDLDSGLRGLLSRMRGEWPCVPFGGVSVPANMPAGWTARVRDKDNFFHGFAAHNYWELLETREGYIHLSIDYPEDSPVVALNRWIYGCPDGPTLIVKLGIKVKSEVDLPVALHLTFRMPTAAGSLLLSATEIAEVVSYPFQLEPNISRLRPDGRSRTLTAIESIGGSLDLSLLPLPFATEEVVQLVNCQSTVRLQYLSENACVLLNWDRELLPDAVLWLSNGGRFYSPWNGRHFALGVEPVAGPFDLGRVVIPPDGHPLVNRLLKLRPDHQTTLSYTLTATSLK